MLKDIVITENDETIIRPDKDNLIVLPIRDKKEFITEAEAKDIIRLLRGQLILLNVGRKGKGKDKIHSYRKTGCTIGGTE